MRLLALLSFISMLSGSALAGLNLIIEHPRYPFHQKDIYTVNCDLKCDVNISSMDPFKGSTSTPLLKEKIVSLMTELAKGEFPKFPGKPRFLYDIKIVDGTKVIHLKVAYPKSYRGTDYSKFTALINRIEELKFIMRKSEAKP